MKKTISKIAVSVATVGLLTGLFAQATFAATISGNGALSKNKVVEISNCTSKVKQTNNAVVVTSVSQSGKTGKNSNSFNTGGTNTINTGSVNNTATVTVSGGTNSAAQTDPCCACQQAPSNNLIEDNGALSKNKIVVVNSTYNSVKQTNNLVATTSVSQSGNTGGNSNSFNTGTDGTNSVTTGDVSNTATVTVEGQSNTLTP